MQRWVLDKFLTRKGCYSSNRIWHVFWPWMDTCSCSLTLSTGATSFVLEDIDGVFWQRDGVSTSTDAHFNPRFRFSSVWFSSVSLYDWMVFPLSRLNYLKSTISFYTCCWLITPWSDLRESRARDWPWRHAGITTLWHKSCGSPLEKPQLEMGPIYLHCI